VPAFVNAAFAAVPAWWGRGHDCIVQRLLCANDIGQVMKLASRVWGKLCPGSPVSVAERRQDPRGRLQRSMSRCQTGRQVGGARAVPGHALVCTHEATSSSRLVKVPSPMDWHISCHWTGQSARAIYYSVGAMQLSQYAPVHPGNMHQPGEVKQASE
jgi:hypothetical protein